MPASKSGDRPQIVLQPARSASSRQVRRASAAREHFAPTAPKTTSKRKEVDQRRSARARGVRTAKQVRPQVAPFAAIDIDITIVIKFSMRRDARRSQFRQAYALRRPTLARISPELIAQLPVAKRDLARSAQGRQIQAAKVTQLASKG